MRLSGYAAIAASRPIAQIALSITKAQEQAQWTSEVRSKVRKKAPASDHHPAEMRAIIGPGPGACS